MLSDQEWIALLEHLLRRLTAIGALDTVNEVRAAISTRIIEEPDSSLESEVPLSHYRDVGTRNTRLPTPKEAFEQALIVIQTRLEMLPSIGEHTVRMLQRKPSNIIWKAEDRDYLFLSNIQEFSESDLIMSQNDRQTISDVLKRLDELIQES